MAAQLTRYQWSGAVSGRKGTKYQAKVREAVQRMLLDKLRSATRWATWTLAQRIGSGVQPASGGSGESMDCSRVGYVPTPGSWLNLLEQSIRGITETGIRRDVFRNVLCPGTAIMTHFEAEDADPKKRPPWCAMS